MTRFIGVQRIRTIEREGILKILSVQFSHFILGKLKPKEVKGLAEAHISK